MTPRAHPKLRGTTMDIPKAPGGADDQGISWSEVTPPAVALVQALRFPHAASAGNRVRRAVRRHGRTG